jgi:hypothetical protein
MKVDTQENTAAEQETLGTLFLNHKTLKNKIYSFLVQEDFLELSMTSKRLNKVLTKDQDSIETLGFERYLQSLKRKKKAKKFIRGKNRCNIYDFDPKFLASKYQWTLLNESEKDNKELWELLHGIIPSKFLKDFAWNIFYSQVFNKYIIVNRVLVDPYMK